VQRPTVSWKNHQLGINGLMMVRMKKRRMKRNRARILLFPPKHKHTFLTEHWNRIQAPEVHFPMKSTNCGTQCKKAQGQRKSATPLGMPLFQGMQLMGTSAKLIPLGQWCRGSGMCGKPSKKRYNSKEWVRVRCFGSPSKAMRLQCRLQLTKDTFKCQMTCISGREKYMNTSVVAQIHTPQDPSMHQWTRSCWKCCSMPHG